MMILAEASGSERYGIVMQVGNIQQKPQEIILGLGDFFFECLD